MGQGCAGGTPHSLDSTRITRRTSPAGCWTALSLRVPHFPRTPLPGYLPRDPELTILTQLGRFLSSVPSGFVPSGCCTKNTTDWAAYEQQELISHRSGGWKWEIRVAARLGSGESPLRVTDGSLPCASARGREQRGEASALQTLTRALTPFMRVPPS